MSVYLPTGYNVELYSLFMLSSSFTFDIFTVAESPFWVVAQQFIYTEKNLSIEPKQYYHKI